MKKDLEQYVHFYKDIQQIEGRLRRATDLANQLGIDAVLADKMETARQGIEEHLDKTFGGKPATGDIAASNNLAERSSDHPLLGGPASAGRTGKQCRESRKL